MFSMVSKAPSFDFVSGCKEGREGRECEVSCEERSIPYCPMLPTAKPRPV